MADLASKIFKMYEKSMIEAKRDKCNAIRLKPSQKLLGPISFWHLGAKFDDKRVPTIAFVGKTTWMYPEDYSVLAEKETFYDGRQLINYFFGEALKRYQYWRIIKEISLATYSKEDESIDFLDHIFITNLVKCNVYDKNVGYKNITKYDFFANCMDVFEKEIEIAKPSHIIFFTNDGYDKLINNLCFGYGKNNHYDISDWNKRKTITKRDLRNKTVYWWHRRFPKSGKPQMHFLRTRHPQGAPKEFKEEIINWIQETSASANKIYSGN